MIRSHSSFTAAMVRMTICAALLSSVIQFADAQTNPVERTFNAPTSAIQKALKQLQTSMSGHLPTLDGFAQAAPHPLSNYLRAFFQCTTQVSAAPDGGSVVRVSAKITAWYADGNSAHSGYQLLSSNGRIESDILDQLSDQISSNSPTPGKRSQDSVALPVPKPTATEEPAIAAPVPGSGIKDAFAPTASQGLSAPEIMAQRSTDTKSASKNSDLRTETAELEEVLRNQAHPRNLVAVKKSGTPVVGSPSLTGKTLFLASAEDEFEMLDFNADWVHVRISGLSRGWIWRTNLEMPGGIPDVSPSAPTHATTAADLFQVSREETAQFPGDWVALRGKNVMIISVQKIRENDSQDGPKAKLEFAKSLFDQHYTELARSDDLSGLVMIFDSADGGMIAATVSTIQRWKAGTLNDAAMWHQCYFDPPETFTISSAQPAVSSPQGGR